MERILLVIVAKVAQTCMHLREVCVEPLMYYPEEIFLEKCRHWGLPTLGRNDLVFQAKAKKWPNEGISETMNTT